MFTNRYLTKGVQLEIPTVLQIFMWEQRDAAHISGITKKKL